MDPLPLSQPDRLRPFLLAMCGPQFCPGCGMDLFGNPDSIIRVCTPTAPGTVQVEALFHVRCNCRNGQLQFAFSRDQLETVWPLWAQAQARTATIPST